MKEIHLEIVTPSKMAFNGEILSVKVPGTKGSFQILFNHAPILSSLEIGMIKIVDVENKASYFSTSGGTLEAKNNNVILLVESLESPEEINLKRAEESMQRAKERLSSKNANLDQVRAENSLKRALNRIKLYNKIK
ncbi:MAG: ATP synthase F1 subunit epsilon [Ignavibacteria bacterium]|nr:ATP synthase F1 subunit epsilon [Ignavibacteria bacterium]